MDQQPNHDDHFDASNKKARPSGRRPCGGPSRLGAIRRRILFVATALIATGSISVPAGATELRLSLADALRLARDSAFEVKAAYHDSLAAEHGLGVAKSAWLPTVGVTANALAFYPFDPFQLGIVDIDAGWHEIYTTNLRLAYPLYTGGRRRNDIRLNNEAVAASSSDLSASKLENAYECRQAYIGLLIADRIVSATEKSLERVQIISDDIDNLYAAGLADSIDILETQLSLREVRRKLEEARSERRNASAVLVRFLGIASDVRVAPSEPIPTPRLEGTAAPDSGTVAARPELTAFDHRILAATYRRSLVKSNVLPVISGMGGYALVLPDVGPLGGEWHDFGWLGLSLSWDLNIGGGEFSAADQALESMRSLEMQRKDLERRLTLQARMARNDMETAYNLSQIRGEELDLARRRFRLAEEKRNVGQMSANRFLELEAELTETEQQFEVARLRFFAARTDYLYAIGSGELWGGF